ncbi:MAG: DUF11 domain-containing protein [Chloroflexi bacterium]|nr:DUF11 domain-containing protein [Chloroflexota bacterium]
MRKLIIAAIIGVIAVMGTFGATQAQGVLSHNIVATDADLVLTKGDSPDPVQVGDHLTYTLVVTNHGPATSTSVMLEDTLPGNVTFVSASSTSGTCSETSGLVTCSLGDLSLGGVVTATIIVIPNVATDITNTARVHGNEDDPNNSNNDAAEITTVVASSNQADISVDKAGSPNPVPVGGSLTFIVGVVNHGPATSTGVTLVDTLPAEVTFSSATATAGTCGESGGVVTCDIGTLLPNESATATIIVVADHAGTIVNSVEVDADQVDPVPGNNTDEVTITVVEVTTEMQIDIRPGSDRNPLNLRSRGMLPVAIMGATNFDVNDIDLSTIRFGVDGDNTMPQHRRVGHIKDINSDGIDDMVLHFRTQALGISRDTERGDIVTLFLTGELNDGTEFDGEDTVTIVGNRHHYFGFMDGGKWGKHFGQNESDDEHSDHPSKGNGHSLNDDDDDDHHPSSAGSQGKDKGKSNGHNRGQSGKSHDD